MGDAAFPAALLEQPVEEASRRGGAAPLASGPGRLCAALAISNEAVGVSGRVGVSVAADWPYRFFVRGSPGVSRPEGWGSGASWPGSRRDLGG